MSRYPFTYVRICSHNEKDALTWCWISGSAVTVCPYANASEMLFAPIQHASMCAQRAHRLRAGSRGKSRRYLFAAESIRPDSIKHFSNPSTPLPSETPTAEGQEAVEPINEPIRQSIGCWISRSGAVAISLWSQHEENVWHHWQFSWTETLRI